MSKSLRSAFVAAVVALTASAQTSMYTYAQSAGTYTPITGTLATFIGGPTDLDDGLTNTIPLGFTFNYHGVNYTDVRVCTNGWLAFGTTATSETNYTPLSGTVNDVVAPFGRDLHGANGSLRFETTGAPGSMVFTVQWANYTKFSTTGSGLGDDFNFQVQLFETSNVVRFVYGTCVSNATSNTFDVGLRGAAATDFNNRACTLGSQTWSTTIPGIANTSRCQVVNVLTPPSGLTMDWTPGTAPVLGGNDECAGALGASIGFNYDTLTGATKSADAAGAATGCSTAFTATTPDVWYKFTPANNCQLFLTRYGAGATSLGIYTGACGALTSQACTTGTQLLFAALAGTTYTIRVGNTTAANAGPFILDVQCYDAPSNDECAGATLLPVGTTLFNTFGATRSLDPVGSCSSFTATTLDVWHDVVVPSASTAIITRTGTGASQLGLYASCGAATSLACGTTSISIFLAAGTYKLRVGQTTALSVQNYTLNLQLVPAPGNDDCSGATALAIGANAGSTLGASNSIPLDPAGTCTGFTATTLDVWHSFTVASTCTAIVTRTGTGANQLGLYSGVCGGLTSVNCGTTSVAAVVAPGTYYVRVGQTTAASAGAYSLDFQCAAPPANDECSSASPAALGANAGTTAGATHSADPVGTCSAFTPATVLDVWHSYTAPAAGAFTAALTGTGANQIAVMNDICGSGSSIVCGTTTAATSLMAGQTVLIRVGQTTFASQGAYTLTLSLLTNDECASAIELFDGINPSPPAGVSGQFYTTVGATASAGYATPIITWPGTGANVSALLCPFSTSIGPDAWFKYVATCTSVSVTHCTPAGFTAGTLGDSTIEVYADCMGTTPIACNDDTQSNGCTTQATVQFAATVGQTYYLRAKAFGTGTGTFYMRVRRGAVIESATSVGTPVEAAGPTPPIGTRPRLSGTSPVIGGSGTIFAAQFAASSPAFLFYSNCGAAPTDFSVLWPGLTGYLDLGSIQLLVSGTSGTDGRFSVTGPLPTDPGLVCIPLCFQAVVAPTSMTPTYQFSNLMTMTFAAP